MLAAVYAMLDLGYQSFDLLYYFGLYSQFVLNPQLKAKAQLAMDVAEIARNNLAGDNKTV